MTTEAEIKQQVRDFYDQVGWQTIGEGLYQNARFEDLRPVSRAYIHNCHLRVGRHLATAGDRLLDAGSGPIQYPEYLTYSQGYRHRVCVDLSITALQEARARIGDHGLFVVADVARLPFKPAAFDGVVSLHTIHHLPQEEHLDAYQELYRTLRPGKTGVVVNGWANSPFKRFIRIAFRASRWLRRALGRGARSAREARSEDSQSASPHGTFVEKGQASWLKSEVATRVPLEIRVWRSVNARFLRTFIHPRLGGRGLLRLLFWLEERFPRFFGENGVYPLIVIRKPGQAETAAAGPAVRLQE